ncbi:olfactory receptor 52K1-like [Lissotriton helveticus]
MAADNTSSIQPSFFTLRGIPGLEAHYTWIALPFCFMYITALLGNGTLLFFIKLEPTLHQPMYFFLGMLSLVDFVLCSTIMPKMLSILWFEFTEIYFEACITQMLFIHTFAALESTILLAMAFDRYVAICNPLRYNAIFTNSVVIKIGLASFIRCVLATTPLTYLLKRLSYCNSNIIQHSFCEHMAVAKLACDDITLNNLYGMIVALLVVVVDVILILITYLLILRAVFLLSSKDDRFKAINTCGCHICAILVFYIPGILSTLIHRFGKNVPLWIHILLVTSHHMVPTMVNPIVYGVKTKQIRESIVKQFHSL